MGKRMYTRGMVKEGLHYRTCHFITVELSFYMLSVIKENESWATQC